MLFIIEQNKYETLSDTFLHFMLEALEDDTVPEGEIEDFAIALAAF